MVNVLLHNNTVEQMKAYDALGLDDDIKAKLFHKMELLEKKITQKNQ